MRRWVASVPLLLAACAANEPPPSAIDVTPVFVTEPHACPQASPMAITSQGEPFVLVPHADGVLRAYDPDSGALAFDVAIPAPPGQLTDVTAPPVLFDASHLVVAYQHVLDPATYERSDHGVVVVDLEARALDPTFPALPIAASRPDADGAATVSFLPSHAFSRSALVHVDVPDRTRGLVYVSYGNIRDLQPWHGWLFELDLDAWASGGAASAISGTLLVTPESQCGPVNGDGARDDVCGGGIWSPAGPIAVEDANGFSLYVPTGNGQLDLARGDYANTVMRVGRGLAFDPGCDPSACATFDPIDPSPDCLATCENLFVPRVAPGQGPLAPESGVCDGLGFFACYAALDWDLGANSPTRVHLAGGPDVLVLPAKDGSVYLFDADHLGTLYDREVVVAACGTKTDPCTADWAGMMVTEPVVTNVGGVPIVLVPTFMYDRTHPAGLVALRIVRDAANLPRLEVAWTAPDFASDDARTHFRQHPGRVELVTIAGERFAVLVEVGTTEGTLWVVRVRDGLVAARHPLAGRGTRYVRPLVRGRRVYVHSCVLRPQDPGWVEAFDLAPAPPTKR